MFLSFPLNKKEKNIPIKLPIIFDKIKMKPIKKAKTINMDSIISLHPNSPKITKTIHIDMPYKNLINLKSKM